jgi:hypothetical protein
MAKPPTVAKEVGEDGRGCGHGTESPLGPGASGAIGLPGSQAVLAASLPGGRIRGEV